MIDERMEEQAALHVVGALNEREALEFKQVLNANPELQEFVARLTTATSAVAGSVPSIEPPPQLRAKILAQVAPQQKMVSLPERKSGLALWLGWAFAACLAVVCVFVYGDDTAWKLKWQSQTVLLTQQDQLVQSLQSSTNLLATTVAEQARQISVQAGRITELDQLAQSLESATNDLRQTVLALQETNQLANLKIAMLNSLIADAPKTIGVTLWDGAKQDGVFVVQNLKSLSSDRDYQLWVLDGGTVPVDAGVIHVDGKGGARVEFKAKQPIKAAGAFAVTEEIKGGAASPTLKNMVLVSN